MLAPCKDCKKRALGCHGACKEYKAYDEERKRIRTENRFMGGNSFCLSVGSKKK